MLTKIYVYRDSKKTLHFVWESADIRTMADDDDMTFVGSFDGTVYTDHMCCEQILIDL